MPDAILARICQAIDKSMDNYDKKSDYYGSPVDKIGIKTGEATDVPWPFIRKEFLLNRTKLTPFPHKTEVPYAKARDLPTVFFYEVTTLLEKGGESANIFATKCGDYFYQRTDGLKDKQKLDRDEKSATNLARRMFYQAYSYLLGYLVFKYKISRDDLLSNFLDCLKSLPGYNNFVKGPTEEQYKLYIERVYNYNTTIHEGGECFSFYEEIPEAFRLQDRGINRNIQIALLGPTFLMRAINMHFNTNGCLILSENLSHGISINKVGLSEEFNILKDGCKNYLLLCLYSMAVEWYFLKNPVVSLNCCGESGRSRETPVRVSVVDR